MATKTKFPGLPFHVVQTDETPHQYVSRITDELNYKMLGKGCFAAVYAPPKSDFVVKVGRNMEDGWLNYAADLQTSAHKLSGNKWIPTVHSVEIYEYPDDASTDYYYVAVMERLVPLKDNKATDGFAYALQEVVRIVRDYGKQGVKLFDLIGIDKSLVDVLKLICKHQTYKDIDIHNGNVMKRGTQFVITDPLA
jgi:hypothetical protein